MQRTPPLGQPYPGLPTLVFRPGSLTKRDPAALTANPNDLSCDNCRPNPSRHPGVQPVPMEALDRRGWRLPGRQARGPHLREPGWGHLRVREEMPGRNGPVVRCLRQHLRRGARRPRHRSPCTAEECPRLRWMGLEFCQEGAVRQLLGGPGPPDRGHQGSQPVKGSEGAGGVAAPGRGLLVPVRDGLDGGEGEDGVGAHDDPDGNRGGHRHAGHL